jgi:hypothetical protein
LQGYIIESNIVALFRAKVFFPFAEEMQLKVTLRPFSGPKYSFPLRGNSIDVNITALFRAKIFFSFAGMYN